MGFVEKLIKAFLLSTVVVVAYILLKVITVGMTDVGCITSVSSDSPYPIHQLLYSTNYSSNVLTAEQSAETNSQPKNRNLTIISREFFAYLSKKLYNTTFPGVNIYIQYTVAQSQLKPLIQMEQLQPDFSAVFSNVNSFVYQARIRECKKMSDRHGLFVAIISAPNNFEKRVAIRETWLQHLQLESNSRLLSIVGFGFIVGLAETTEIHGKLQEESIAYGDILQINIVDYYYNLTLKVVGLLKWMNDHCSRVEYLLKVDDDVYVNVKNLITIVRKLNSSELSLYGSAGDSIPLRDVGKNYVSFENWPWSWYPPFIRGGAVLLPGLTIGPLLTASQTIPLFPFDDVYLSGLCTSKAKIKVRFSNRFFIGLRTIYTEPPEPCHVYNYATWLTNSPEHLKKSHFATEEFYHGDEKCFVRGLNGTIVALDPTETVDFSFTDWDTLSETLYWTEVLDK